MTPLLVLHVLCSTSKLELHLICLSDCACNTYLNKLVDAQRSIQLGQLALIGAAQERDQLLKQCLLIITTLRGGGRTQHFIQRTWNTLSAQSRQKLSALKLPVTKTIGRQHSEKHSLLRR